MNKLNNKKYSKDSFDRFGDDLCELLLSYLTINSKIQYESVSKQWQRFIFNKQIKLFITYKIYDENSAEDCNTIIKLVTKKFRFSLGSINLLLLELVLKKFTNIKNLELRSGMGIEIDGNVIQMITNCCNALQKLVIINGYFDQINEKHIQEFGLKFAKSMEYLCIHFINDKNAKIVENIFEFLPNLKIIKFHNFSVINSKPNNFYTKLEEINCISLSIEEWITFTDNYNNQIKRIESSFGNSRAVYLYNIDFNSHLLQLTRFERLQTLKLWICTKGLIDRSLEMIANQCKQLTHLDLSFCPLTDDNIDIFNGQLFQLLAKFVYLIRLKVELVFTEVENDQNFNNYINSHYGSIKSLKSCQNLKYLSISGPKLTDNHLKDINLYLPQLKSIAIKSNTGITDQTLSYFAKMKNLFKVVIKELRNPFLLEEEHHFDITDGSVAQLLNSCPNIHNIKFKCFTKLTELSIDLLKEIANKNPKIYYNFFVISVNKMKTYEECYGIENNVEIPKNLSLELNYISF